MNTQGERIKIRRKELKLTQLQLAKKVGVSHVTVSQWESDTTGLRGQNLDTLAKVLKTSSSWILHGLGPSNSKSLSNIQSAPLPPRTKKLPVISHVQAGNWSEAFDYYAAGDDVQWEDAPEGTSDSAFWLRVIGDSMTSQSGVSITEGMLILVDPEVAPENGKLVVAKLDGTDEVTFKKLAIDAGMKFLKPLNTTYPSIPINGNCQIVGVVVEAKIKF